jgi:hypothetical protein
MPRFIALAIFLFSLPAFAVAQDAVPVPTQETPPPPEVSAPETPAPPAPTSAIPDVAPAPAADATSAPLPPMDATRLTPSESAQHAAEEKSFTQYRHDLINLLALRADPDLLVAAAQLAYPDTPVDSRPLALKTPALLKRAQKYGAEDALVWWISAFLQCTPTSVCPAPEVAQKLEEIDADNVAAWLPALSTEQDPGKSRAVLASMAQAKRFDDYWARNVRATYRALETLPVPADVLREGINATAARLNFATSVGGGFVPSYQRLIQICHAAEATVTADCLAIAHSLESGGTFISQAIGFSIEEALLPEGPQRDVLRARKRTAAWQRQNFIEVSARFPRDAALAQNYVDLLHTQHDELAIVAALLRDQHIAYDPPTSWKAPDALAAPPHDALAH